VNSHFEINVRDTGPGIDPNFLPYVFERFRQGDSSTTKKHGGLGLGLAIVRQLTELHGGSAEVGNSAEGGAIFTVKLPVMVAKSQSAAPPVQQSSAVGAFDRPLTFDCPEDLENIRVLAVDDDADSRLLLSTILEECGAVVKTCESSAEALETIADFRPDIVVSDIGMPDEDGYMLIRKLRASEKKGERVPAIALTAFARTEDRMKALSAGFNMHVPKPVEPAELMTVIASLINHK
jgi:CheY-like chemotaxis protein